MALPKCSFVLFSGNPCNLALRYHMEWDDGLHQNAKRVRKYDSWCPSHMKKIAEMSFMDACEGCGKINVVKKNKICPDCIEEGESLL